MMEKHHKHKTEHTKPTEHPEETKEQKLEKQLDETKDKLLRALAEADNLRKRAERERSELNQYAITNFARDLLVVADNLTRAIESMEKADHENLNVLLEGVKLTEKELNKVFEKYNIKKIEPLNLPFDHNFHQAIFEVERDDTPAGTVVQLMQAGYLLEKRLLRPAMVGVSKPKAHKSE
jgi:molecular chaperone GrpE